MTNTLTKNRIESIDLLKGLVMVIMALDHVRDFFHYDAFHYDPADPLKSTLPIFFTRWITHFCAPAFSFLAGISAYLVGRRKSKNELSAFLFKRGLWLVIIELTVVTFGWTFDIHFRSFFLGTIWSLGISMIFLALLIRLPIKFILILSLTIIVGHHVLDNVHFPGSILWSIIHEQGFFNLPGNVFFGVVYPIVPWIAVMSVGYAMGTYYDRSVDPAKRKKMFNMIGLASLVLFVILRFTNIYGDPTPFVQYEHFSQSLISFLNPNKYPPSFLYLLMTLGGSFIFLANAENLKGKVVEFFCTFGRVPFFYYIMHLYLMHLIAVLFAGLAGFGWDKMFLSGFVIMEPGFENYGFSLWVVYAVWIVLILLLYPLCRKFDKYKQGHKEKWWLSYL